MTFARVYQELSPTRYQLVTHCPESEKADLFRNRLSLNLVAGAGFEPTTFARGYKELSPTSSQLVTRCSESEKAGTFRLPAFS